MEESRSAKTIRNAKVALIYYFINLVLNFFSRKIFIDYLGAEVLGLNTTATNLLGFLNIAELGIGAAIASSLYTPIFNKDRKTICEIVSVQGWLYHRVALIVLAGALVLMVFFPLIFEKADVPMWYTYATFFVLLVSSLLGYFVNYRQIVLTADQKDYKITIHIKTLTFIKVICQILTIRFLPNGYVYWLVLEFLFAFLNAYALDRLIKREYPWLQTSVKAGGQLRKQYPDIILKTKQLFAHKIGGFALSQTSPLIIYAFTSLTLVAIYGNYMLIIMGLMGLINAIFNSITAGVGSLVAEGNKEKTMNFFWEFASFRFWIASVICVGFYLFSHPFIELWVGKEYLLDNTTLLLLTIFLFLQLTRVSDPFLNAYGLFKDIGAPLIEATLNISLSILLGYVWGLNGIILGVIISLLCVVASWKPFFLFRNAFRHSIWLYFKKISVYILLSLVSISVSFLLFAGKDSWGYSLMSFTLFIVANFLFFTACDKSFLSFVKRVVFKFAR